MVKYRSCEIIIIICSCYAVTSYPCVYCLFIGNKIINMDQTYETCRFNTKENMDVMGPLKADFIYPNLA